MADIKLGLDLHWDVSNGQLVSFVSLTNTEDELVSVTFDWETLSGALEDDLEVFQRDGDLADLSDWADLSKHLRQLADNIDAFLVEGVKKAYGKDE